jgi:hypothetical protein
VAREPGSGGVQEQRGEERKKEGRRREKGRKEKRKEKRKKRKKKKKRKKGEREGNASAPVAAATAAGRPRALYSREERKERCRVDANHGGRPRVGDKPSSDAERDSGLVRVRVLSSHRFYELL